MNECDIDSCDLLLIPVPTLSAQPHHPTDQEDCVVIACPDCKELGWLSRKKRELIEYTDRPTKVMCYDCLIKWTKKEGKDGAVIG